MITLAAGCRVIGRTLYVVGLAGTLVDRREPVRRRLERQIWRQIRGRLHGYLLIGGIRAEIAVVSATGSAAQRRTVLFRVAARVSRVLVRGMVARTVRYSMVMVVMVVVTMLVSVRWQRGRRTVLVHLVVGLLYPEINRRFNYSSVAQKLLASSPSTDQMHYASCDLSFCWGYTLARGDARVLMDFSCRCISPGWSVSCLFLSGLATFCSLYPIARHRPKYFFCSVFQIDR